MNEIAQIVADIARSLTIERFGDPEDLMWHHWFYCDTVGRYVWLHYDECYEGCGCQQMEDNDILYLLPPHQELLPLRGYVRVYRVDNTKLSPPSPNSLFNLAFSIVQKQLLNFVSIMNRPSWHFADFKYVQQILQDEFRVPPKISYYALPPLDFFTKHAPGDECDVRNVVLERSPTPPPRPESPWPDSD